MSIFSKNQTKKVVVNAENHGYKPNTVTFKQGKPAQLKFIPSDNMGCMNEVVSKDLNFDQKLDGKKKLRLTFQLTSQVLTPTLVEWICSAERLLLNNETFKH